MQLKVLNKFIGPSIYSNRAGLVLSFSPPNVISFELDSLGDRFQVELSDTLKRIKLNPVMHGDILKARNFGELVIVFALQIQRHTGAFVERGRLLKLEPSGQCLLFYECETVDVGIQAGNLAVRFISDILSRSGIYSPKEITNSELQLEKLVRYASEYGVSGTHRYLMKAARDAGFPALYLGNKFLQLGHGRFRRLLWRSITDATPWTAVERSTDKVVTMQMLKNLGLNVPAQYVVRTPEQALEAARTIGFPVVAKPRRQDRQVGVTVDIENEKELLKAYNRARKYGGNVIIEEMLQGENYRVIVINGEIVSALERHPAHVVGDGKQTVSKLVEVLNRDPRRGLGGNTPLTVLELDNEADAVLAARGYTRSTVPKRGERVDISSFPNARVSDATRDVTDIIHPDVSEAMLLGVRALGLDIAGVDYITPDISRAPKEVGGGFCEINCTPMLQPHYATMPRDMASPIFNMMFSGGRPEHVPIIAICSEERQSRVHGLLRLALEKAGYTIGCTTREGIWADGKQLRRDDSTNPMSARTLLQDVRINAAILDTPIDVVVKQGLGIDSCDVVVIDTIGENGNGHKSDETVLALETLAKLAHRAVVIDFDHPHRAKLSHDQDAGNFIIVSTRLNPSDLDGHISKHGAAIVFDVEANSPAFTLISGDGSMKRIPCPELDRTDNQNVDIRAIAFAIAGAFAIGLSTDALWK